MTPGSPAAPVRDPAAPPGARWRPWLALALVLLGVGALLGLPLRTWLASAVAAAQSLGPAGAWFFMALFVPACVLCLPGTPITLFCAYTYGFWTTWPAAVVMSNLGAALTVLLSRWLLRDGVERWLGRRPRLLALRRAIGARSFRLVFLLRLTPLVPFNGLNYALGTTPLRFGPYLLATFLGMLPGTAVNTYTAATLGELGASLEGEISLGTTGVVLLALRLLAALLVTAWIARLARRALAGELAGGEPLEASAPARPPS